LLLKVNSKDPFKTVNVDSKRPFRSGRTDRRLRGASPAAAGHADCPALHHGIPHLRAFIPRENYRHSRISVTITHSGAVHTVYGISYPVFVHHILHPVWKYGAHIRNAWNGASKSQARSGPSYSLLSLELCSTVCGLSRFFRVGHHHPARAPTVAPAVTVLGFRD